MTQNLQRYDQPVIMENAFQVRIKFINFGLIYLSYQLALRASILLEHTKLSELRAGIARSLSELEMFTEEGTDSVYTPRRRSAIEQRIEDVVNSGEAVEDALVSLFDHSDHTLQRRVVETYIRRIYQVLSCYSTYHNLV